MINYSDNARKIQIEVKKILFEDWDPIGVNDIPDAQDEYDMYVGDIYKMLIQHKSIDEIVDYLWWIETDRMGLVGNKQKTSMIARKLHEIYENLKNRFDGV